MKPRSNNPFEIITHHANGILSNPCAKTQHQTVNIIDDGHAKRWFGFQSEIFRRTKLDGTPGNYYHVGYHFVIWYDGTRWRWTQTRAIFEEGAHVIGKNRSSIGVVVVGNYDKCSGEKIPPEAQDVWIDVYKEIQLQMDERFGRFIQTNDINPHRKYASKSCHGNSLPDDYFARVIVEARPDNKGATREQMEEQIKELQRTLFSLLKMWLVILMNRTTPQRLSYREKIIN